VRPPAAGQRHYLLFRLRRRDARGPKRRRPRRSPGQPGPPPTAARSGVEPGVKRDTATERPRMSSCTAGSGCVPAPASPAPPPVAYASVPTMQMSAQERDRRGAGERVKRGAARSSEGVQPRAPRRGEEASSGRSPWSGPRPSRAEQSHHLAVPPAPQRRESQPVPERPGRPPRPRARARRRRARVSSQEGPRCGKTIDSSVAAPDLVSTRPTPGRRPSAWHSVRAWSRAESITSGAGLSLRGSQGVRQPHSRPSLEPTTAGVGLGRRGVDDRTGRPLPHAPAAPSASSTFWSPVGVEEG